MRDLRKSFLAAAGLVVLAALVVPAAWASSPAAQVCPPISFNTGNLALNDGFEVPTPNVPPGSETCWQNGDPPYPPSAADGWTMHSSNSGAKVCSRLIPSSVPSEGGSQMLQFSAAGNEGGVYEALNLDPTKSYMFSVWVYVRQGQVAIQSNLTTGGPGAWSSKIGQWEQLRVCTNGLFSTNALVIFNEDPNGGVFFLDRAELREIYTQP